MAIAKVNRWFPRLATLAAAALGVFVLTAPLKPADAQVYLGFNAGGVGFGVGLPIYGPGYYGYYPPPYPYAYPGYYYGYGW
ncbi:MAG TPA: hypothetical protein VFA12_16780 [Stellaceae bacterium]|nr:hypothetical protein [Stellaceae bacterium]